MMWEKVKIKNITINLDNRRKPLNEQERNKISKKKLYPYIGANNIMDYVDEYLFDEEIICIAEDGGSWGEHQKCVVHFSEKCWVNNHAHVLSSNGKSDLKYLMYYLNAKDLTKFITGSTRGKLTKSALDSIQIPLPPLPIQKRIAEILDTADALRRKDEALLKKYDELAQAIFIDMFGDPVKNEKGWEVNKLGEVCDKITDGTHDTPERLTKGVKFITGKHIRPFTIDYDNSDYVTEDVHNEIYKRCNPEIGDILYTNIGVNYATAAMNTVNYQFSMKNVALLKYNRAKLSGRYLEHQLNNEFFKAKLKTLTGIGGAQQFLSLAQIKSISILIPNKKLQLEFENLIDKVYKIIEKQRLNTDYSTNLFNSLLQKAFNGELIV